jgi:DNA-directed RNA polymerase specialized sigma24 family protein
MRQVFTLRKVYEQNPQQIAATLGLSEHEVERCLTIGSAS